MNHDGKIECKSNEPGSQRSIHDFGNEKWIWKAGETAVTRLELRLKRKGDLTTYSTLLPVESHSSGSCVQCTSMTNPNSRGEHTNLSKQKLRVTAVCETRNENERIRTLTLNQSDPINHDCNLEVHMFPPNTYWHLLLELCSFGCISHTCMWTVLPA